MADCAAKCQCMLLLDLSPSPRSIRFPPPQSPRAASTPSPALLLQEAGSRRLLAVWQGDFGRGGDRIAGDIGRRHRAAGDAMPAAAGPVYLLGSVLTCDTTGTAPRWQLT